MPSVEFMSYSFCGVVSSMFGDSHVCYFLDGWFAWFCCARGVMLLLSWCSLSVFDVFRVLEDVANVVESGLVGGGDIDGE